MEDVPAVMGVIDERNEFRVKPGKFSAAQATPKRERTIETGLPFGQRERACAGQISSVFGRRRDRDLLVSYHPA